ncbi:ER-domain-containing protein [Lichtheimia hyalospora FSU 10163]|nr:ER-domain-containing protein [Lichtheimia hyalospora FSU 10163]
MTTHTILLIQPDQQPRSRTYYDFETVAAAMDAIAGMYEQELQQQNPRVGQIQYRAEDLFQFIDAHKEFVALVFEPSQRSYSPRNNEWIKERLIAHFSRQPGVQQQRGSGGNAPRGQANRRPGGGSGGRYGRRW